MLHDGMQRYDKTRHALLPIAECGSRNLQPSKADMLHDRKLIERVFLEFLADAHRVYQRWLVLLEATCSS